MNVPVLNLCYKLIVERGRGREELNIKSVFLIQQDQTIVHYWREAQKTCNSCS